jgi:hypothetical protein
LKRREKAAPIFRDYVKRWNGKPYKTDPRKRWKLSYPTLTRLFYGWLRAGKSDRVFELGYRGCSFPVPPALVERLIEICGEPGIDSIKKAIDALRFEWCHNKFLRNLGTLRDWLKEQNRAPKGRTRQLPFPFNPGSLHRKLTSGQKRVIRALHRARHQAALAERRARRKTALAEKEFQKLLPHHETNQPD